MLIVPPSPHDVFCYKKIFLILSHMLLQAMQHVAMNITLDPKLTLTLQMNLILLCVNSFLPHSQQNPYPSYTYLLLLGR